MGALRVAFQRGESSNSLMERVDGLGSRQIINVVEGLKPFDLDLAETVIHRLHGRIIGCGAFSGGRGVRGQAVAKRIHSRTRFALLTAICRCDAMGPYFPDAATSWAAMAFSAAKRSARALALEVLSRSSRNTF